LQYISTRGRSRPIDFQEALLSGLAPDGGLYVPQHWPQFSPKEIQEVKGVSYTETALRIIKPFVGTSIAHERLAVMINEAYGQIGHRAKCPLVQIGDNLFLCELFHGPTLAFKDFALQLVSRMLTDVLKQRNQKCVIVGATSGDTGSAAIEAFRGLEQVEVFILYPDGKVSDIQRRQMTTPQEANVHAIAVQGTFDDCQNLVKQMFGDTTFRAEMNLAAINSINWARIVSQIVYYFYSAVTVGAPENSISFVVPTGNFGDIYAGYAAKQMGLPVTDLVIATNQNDILYQALNSGHYHITDVRPSISPSMDIQVSSNFERVLFEAGGKDSHSIQAKMQDLQKGGFKINEVELNYLRKYFSAGRSSERETRQVMADTLRETGQVICPHTAVGVKVAQELKQNSPETVITLSTAHPAKFPDAVKDACGIIPQLPDRLSKRLKGAEKIHTSPNSLSELQEFMRSTLNC